MTAIRRLTKQLSLFLITSTLLAALPHDAYIWQRAWGDALRDSIAEHVDVVSGLTCLAAEITPRADGDAVALIDLDYAALIASGRPVTLAIRISQYPGPFSADMRTTQTLLRVSGEVLARAKDKGLDVAALEIDFDAATSKLEGYQQWLRLLRAEHPSTPLSITTLPTWMSRPEAFAQLVASVDHFVLQVHSIQRPQKDGGAIKLCDAKQSLDWVEQAAGFGRPFHVALPTYAYEIGFNARGELVSVTAENGLGRRNPQISYERVEADPVEMSELVQQLNQLKCDRLRGIIWYRLPVRGDRLNWDAELWRQVRDGDVQPPAWQVLAVPQNNGVIEIQICQNSITPTPAPKAISLQWSGAEAVAWDGQRHFSVSQSQPKTLTFQRASDSAPLPKGARWTIGWLRLDQPADLQLTILP